MFRLGNVVLHCLLPHWHCGIFLCATVAGWIIEAGGGIGAYGRNVNSVAKSGAQGAYTGGKASAAGMGAAVGNIGGRIKGMLIKGK